MGELSVTNQAWPPVLAGGFTNACLPERGTSCSCRHVNCKQTSGTVHGTQSVMA